MCVRALSLSKRFVTDCYNMWVMVAVQWTAERDMRDTCFICSRGSYDFEHHGMVPASLAYCLLIGWRRWWRWQSVLSICMCVCDVSATLCLCWRALIITSTMNITSGPTSSSSFISTTRSSATTRLLNSTYIAWYDLLLVSTAYVHIVCSSYCCNHSVQWLPTANGVWHVKTNTWQYFDKLVSDTQLLVTLHCTLFAL